MKPNTPEKMYNISNSQLSIARWYGCIKFNGADYVYNPKDDTLTRGDILAKENEEKCKKVEEETCQD